MTWSGKENSAAPLRAGRPWFVLRSFDGWRPGDLSADVVAGLTLAAIAIPSQMATARLANLTPQIGLLALIAGAIGFAIFGDSRRLIVGADSTIAPIFAGALAVVAAAGPAHYALASSALGILVGLILVCSGALRLGFIADLLSIPVTNGFFIGIAGHILISQAPSVLGVEPGRGPLAEQALSLITRAQAANPWTLVIGLGVFAIMLVGKRLSPRLPAALVGLCLAELATVALGLEARGVATLGSLARAAPHFSLPMISSDEFRIIAPLAVLITLVVMVQTAATTRSFPDSADGPDINRDFIGVGAANVFAGFIGAFPVDASPPTTEVVGGGGLEVAARGLALGRGRVADSALRRTAARPRAFRRPRGSSCSSSRYVSCTLALSPTYGDRSPAEFLLIVVTALAILALPIEEGVGVGVLLSVLHGVWTTTRAQAVEFETHSRHVDLVAARRGYERRVRSRRPGYRAAGASVVSQRLQFSSRHRALRLAKTRRLS